MSIRQRDLLDRSRFSGCVLLGRSTKDILEQLLHTIAMAGLWLSLDWGVDSACHPDMAILPILTGLLLFLLSLINHRGRLSS